MVADAATPADGRSADAATLGTKEEPEIVSSAEASTESASKTAAPGDTEPPVPITDTDVPAVAAAAEDVEGAAATEVVEVVEQVVNEIPPIDPAVSFDTARGVVRQIHDVLSKLESSKRKQEADGGDVEEFPELARDLQLHMLSLRRAHRAMAKAADASRVAEAAARKAADEDHAELETRQYESACSRAEARRCRQFPAPELATLEPFLDPGPEEGENSDDELLGREPDAKGVLAPRRGLMARLESEHAERVRLATELAKQEAQKKEDLGALRAREQISADLAARLRIVDEALEPVCGLLELRSEPDLGTPESLASQLPEPLRLIHAKFSTLAALGDSGVNVAVEGVHHASGDGPPPEKRPRLEGSAAVPTVCVDIAPSVGSDKADALARLRFTAPRDNLVAVAGEGRASGTVLDSLWSHDNGTGSLTKLSPVPTVGRPYYWAQVLAGLREHLVSAAAAHVVVDGVSATDLVLRLRERLRETT